jgi:iron donor protein CyaY
MNMLNDQEFQLKADQSLRELYRSLAVASDQFGFETDFGGTLTVEFDDPPTKFVVSPNSPVKQIWISAEMKSYKLEWNSERGEFVLPETGESMKDVLSGAISRQIGESVKL